MLGDMEKKKSESKVINSVYIFISKSVLHHVCWCAEGGQVQSVFLLSPGILENGQKWPKLRAKMGRCSKVQVRLAIPKIIGGMPRLVAGGGTGFGEAPQFPQT